MSESNFERIEGASVAARISNHVVQMMSAYTGRGPTKAWTSIDADLITVVLRETLTKGERSLLADGREKLVLETRQAYQYTMRNDLVEGVEQLSGRKVIAFLSANHIEPDIAIESFVLEPQEATVTGARSA
ncbi:MAG TPA: Na-translocating system protein MpsC family protein [Solirubrobacteraceae bacterium]|jgi:uncharacterized protein YbcI|nr:Na-translocating system protein MpsC family protein [Solirubrobacteraceae bacterium]